MMNTHHLIALCSVLALQGCDYKAPLDDKLPPPGNVISGTIVAPVLDQPAAAYVLVFDADNPGPPIGTGSPITFATAPPQDFFNEGAGFMAAEYAVGKLPDGDYLVTTLLDLDGNFNPFATTLAGSTCGDLLGGYTTPEGIPTPVHVSGGIQVDGVTLFVGREVTQHRPAFGLEPLRELAGVPWPAGADPFVAAANAVVLDKETGQGSAADQNLLFNLRYQLGATKVAIPYSEDASIVFPGPEDTVSPCTTRFPLLGVDADLDGLVDLRPEPSLAAAGIADIWPRVYLEYLGQPTAEKDENGATVFDNPYAEAGETWVSENFPFAVEHGADLGIVFPGLAQPNVPTPVDSMPVLWVPVAKHYYPEPGMGEEDELFRGEEASVDTVDLRVPNTGLDAIPSGAWRMTVINHQGQTWQVPNEAAVVFDISLDPTNYDPASQGGVLVTQ